MSASINDRITDVRNAARPVSTTVSSGRSAGGATLSCGSLLGWPTASKVHFVTYKIDSSSNPVAGTQLDCYAIVSGSDLTSFTVVDGTDTGHAIGDIVEMLPSAAWGQDLADALTVGHTRTGAHIPALPLTSPVLTTPVITDYTSAGHTHVSTVQGGQLNGATALQSASTDSSRINFGGSGAGIWWEEIGRTTLGVAGDSISVASLAARKYLMVYFSLLNSGQIAPRIQANGDTGANYSFRSSANGGADTTGTSVTAVDMIATETSVMQGSLFIVNITAQEKIVDYRLITIGSAGAGSAPTRIEGGGKWVNTAAQISRIDLINLGTGDFNTGSEVVVLGHN